MKCEGLVTDGPNAPKYPLFDRPVCTHCVEYSGYHQFSILMDSRIVEATERLYSGPEVAGCKSCGWIVCADCFKHCNGLSYKIKCRCGRSIQLSNYMIGRQWKIEFFTACTARKFICQTLNLCKTDFATKREYNDFLEYRESLIDVRENYALMSKEKKKEFDGTIKKFENKYREHLARNSAKDEVEREEHRNPKPKEEQIQGTMQSTVYVPNHSIQCRRQPQPLLGAKRGPVGPACRKRARCAGGYVASAVNKRTTSEMFSGLLYGIDMFIY